ncbi:MAG: hypothetical protein RDU20_15635 [Desulfomonilaceae bacterium]|nr:hypothetical protein [Desulfomonilaceae bacterium]
MFLDKLWLRIRGELLTLREDFSTSEDIRERAANLLSKLEKRIAGEEVDDHGRPRDVSSPLSRYDASTVGPSDPPSLEDLKREWDDISKQRRGTSGDSEEADSPPPNPRELG